MDNDIFWIQDIIILYDHNMSIMPNRLVPEADGTFSTGALWRQWYCSLDVKQRVVLQTVVH